ncbi:MAG: ketoacyl-ACP synthase III [Flavobacteriaceae bacterium]|nr:ketoacyl-ACP synthase III [Flavobacteriaceae bacterium]
MKIPTEIIGTGIYAPGESISNEELIKISGIEFDTEKISNKIGIKNRHIAKYRGLDESTADFCTNAANNALKDAKINADEIDLIIVGTDTPEFITPATSIIVQGRLQKSEKWTSTFDVSASCASFSVAYDNAVRIMATNSFIKYALVIGVYNMPSFIKDNDNFSLPIFADGAGAVVIKNNSNSNYVDSQLLTDGTQHDYIGIYNGAAKTRITKDLIDKGEFGLQSLKPLPGDRNVKLWPKVIDKLMTKTGLKVDEIDHFFFTQISAFVIREVMKSIGQPMHKTTMIMDKYGYTGSACIPMAFHHAILEKRIKKGDKIVFVTSGAGLSVSSNMFIY